MPSGIYEVRNRVNGKTYVGSAVDLARRWREHSRRIANGTHHSEIMMRAWAKYGAESFEFRPLFVCAPRDLLFYEQRALDVLRPAYNLCAVAGSMLGVKRKPFSAEHRAALSAARKLRAKETRTDDQKKRMSAAQKKVHAGGKRKPRSSVSEETRIKLSLASKGNTNGRFTKGLPKPPVSGETRAKLRAASVVAWANRRARGTACRQQD
jgi:group I intron endonuclease